MKFDKIIIILALIMVNPPPLNKKNRATLIVYTLELLKWYKIRTASLF